MKNQLTPEELKALQEMVNRRNEITEEKKKESKPKRKRYKRFQ